MIAMFNSIVERFKSLTALFHLHCSDTQASDNDKFNNKYLTQQQYRRMLYMQDAVLFQPVFIVADSITPAFFNILVTTAKFM